MIRETLAELATWPWGKMAADLAAFIVIGGILAAVMLVCVGFAPDAPLI